MSIPLKRYAGAPALTRQALDNQKQALRTFSQVDLKRVENLKIISRLLQVALYLNVLAVSLIPVFFPTYWWMMIVGGLVGGILLNIPKSRVDKEIVRIQKEYEALKISFKFLSKDSLKKGYFERGLGDLKPVDPKLRSDLRFEDQRKKEHPPSATSIQRTIDRLDLAITPANKTTLALQSATLKMGLEDPFQIKALKQQVIDANQLLQELDHENYEKEIRKIQKLALRVKSPFAARLSQDKQAVDTVKGCLKQSLTLLKDVKALIAVQKVSQVALENLKRKFEVADRLLKSRDHVDQGDYEKAIKGIQQLSLKCVFRVQDMVKGALEELKVQFKETNPLLNIDNQRASPGSKQKCVTFIDISINETKAHVARSLKNYKTMREAHDLFQKGLQKVKDETKLKKQLNNFKAFIIKLNHFKEKVVSNGSYRAFEEAASGFEHLEFQFEGLAKGVKEIRDLERRFPFLGQEVSFLSLKNEIKAFEKDKRKIKTFIDNLEATGNFKRVVKTQTCGFIALLKFRLENLNKQVEEWLEDHVERRFLSIKSLIKEIDGIDSSRMTAPFKKERREIERKLKAFEKAFEEVKTKEVYAKQSSALKEFAKQVAAFKKKFTTLSWGEFARANYKAVFAPVKPVGKFAHEMRFKAQALVKPQGLEAIGKMIGEVDAIDKSLKTLEFKKMRQRIGNQLLRFQKVSEKEKAKTNYKTALKKFEGEVIAFKKEFIEPKSEKQTLLDRELRVADKAFMRRQIIHRVYNLAMVIITALILVYLHESPWVCMGLSSTGVVLGVGHEIIGYVLSRASSRIKKLKLESAFRGKLAPFRPTGLSPTQRKENQTLQRLAKECHSHIKRVAENPKKELRVRLHFAEKAKQVFQFSQDSLEKLDSIHRGLKQRFSWERHLTNALDEDRLKYPRSLTKKLA